MANLLCGFRSKALPDVELYTPATIHKEAIDWARLSMSKIAKELNDKSMEEIFMNPKDALDKMAVQPDWKPHTLAKRIEQLAKPDMIKQQSQRKQVAMSYKAENTIAEVKKKNARNKQWNDKNKTKDRTAEAVPTVTPIEQPKTWNPLEQTITMTATNTQEEGTEDTANKNIPKFGHNTISTR
jgi:hypothetical protein